MIIALGIAWGHQIRPVTSSFPISLSQIVAYTNVQPTTYLVESPTDTM